MFLNGFLTMQELKKYSFSKILITRTDKIGDIVLTLPLIHEAKRIFPSAEITFLVSKRIGNLIDNYPNIDRLIFIEDFGFLSLTKFIYRQNFTAGICVYPRFKLALSMFFGGIKFRSGTGYRWYSFLFNRKVYQHRKFSEKHESEYNIALLEPFADNISAEKKFDFAYNDNEQRSLETKLSRKGLNLDDRYIIIHPGSKGSGIDLPVSTMREAAEMLSVKFKNYKIVLTGTAEENDIAGLFARDNRKICNLCGILDLRELMILIDNCRLFISNSTGPAHIAGALNKKIIAFYTNSAPMNARRWKPLSRFAVIITPPAGDDMTEIRVDEIMSAVMYLLND